MCKLLTTMSVLALTGGGAMAADLEITAYNPGTNSLFAATSSLIEGPTEVILVDAQFEKDDAQDLVQMILDSGKTLTTVFISHQDPDFYFGLGEIRANFPDVDIVATPETTQGIQATIQGKSDFWGPILGENAPDALIVPDVLDGDTLTVDGEEVKVIGLDGHDPKHTFLWVPSVKTILGGVPVYENVHVWTADNQTPESRDDWRATLEQMVELNPERLIPGHFMGETAGDLSAIGFTRDYIATFEGASAVAQSAKELVDAMTRLYPDFPNIGDLELSAQVAEGERAWP